MFQYGFEVGDTVQFKSWDELCSQYERVGDGLRAPLFFNNAMRYLCGQIVHIKNLRALSSYDEFTTEEGIEDSSYRHWFLSTDFVKAYTNVNISEPEWSEVLGS